MTELSVTTFHYSSCVVASVFGENTEQLLSAAIFAVEEQEINFPTSDSSSVLLPAGLLTMFNGYNDTPLISYEFGQERVEKKHEKWSYGHDAGVQSAHHQANNRHAEFWPGKSNFLGIPNVVKCNCTGCYPSSEKQSYQGDTTRHRPWLPRSFQVPVNGSDEPCKLPACQWDTALPNPNYGESGLPYVQENGGKYSYYKHHQNARLAESNQPGVITSLKSADYPKKPKSDVSHGQESPVQNGVRHPVFCNPAYGLTKRIDGRNYCDAIEKYSNGASYPTVGQHMPRLPVVEPFTKAVPSNLSQSRVPSTGYRSVKENMPQPRDLGYGDARKICTEPEISCDQRTDVFSGGQIQAGVHEDYSHFYRDLPEMEPQKLFFDNTRHPDYYSRANFQDAIKRNNQTLDNRKDCAVNQINEVNVSEQHYNISRRYQDAAGNSKPCDIFCSKDFDKMRPENHLPENSLCFQRSDEAKNENANVRLPSSALIFNDPRFADRTQNTFTYQSNPVVYRNYLRAEYPCQGYNAQTRYEYPPGLQRNDLNQCRGAPQQIQPCEQLDPQQGTGFAYDPRYQLNPEKTETFFRGKNPPPVQVDSQTSENKNPTYLEAIRSDELNKNGTSKISPLRLLRKKKFINVPQESAPVSTLDAVPGLDVRKFWSTWAEEEEENVAPTQMVVLDCQNIDPEQAKLLHLYETDPVRSIHLETGNTVIKNSELAKESPENVVKSEETNEQAPSEPKIDEVDNSKVEIAQQEEAEKSSSASETESKTDVMESACGKTPSNKQLKRGKSGHENRKKSEIRDKWTEKKFDFLKRAEESKAAEILRHEEEKKKIFETRLSLQQSLKKSQGKNDKTGNEIVPETPFDENSQSDSPEGGANGGDATPLPTCEYRRNKFLDYSDRKVIPNGEDKTGGAEDGNEPAETHEIKKEENIKLEFSDKVEDESWPKFKEEAGFEMEDILKKMSEINFQCPEVKFENGSDSAKKPKAGRKTKKKKSDPTENDDRTDKLTVETVNKQPTIKFSIQKSHDLKISFKVLNSSSKEYSDEDAGGEETHEEGKVGEDSKNSTELITLEYKSIKRDGDRRRQMDLKKNRSRRKKPSPKTPVLKIKKSRYMLEERDPLADEGDVLNVSKTLYHPDKCTTTSDGFQVKETMDSAKIKLTFKRHKGNFETEYKINSNNVEKVSEVEPIRREEHADATGDRCRKKSKRSRRRDIFAEPGVGNPESDVESDSNKGNTFGSPHEEDSRNSSSSRDSYMKEENCSLQSSPMTFSEFSEFAVPTPENEEKLDSAEETVKHDAIEEEEETEKCVPDLVELTSCEESKFPLLGSPDVNSKDEGRTKNFEEEIHEISLDFIAKSQEIDLNHNSEKTEDMETLQNSALDKQSENPVGTGIPEKTPSESENSETADPALRPPLDRITENGWNDVDVSFDSQATATLPSLDLEYDGCVKSSDTLERVEERNEETNERLPFKEDTEPCEVKEVPDDGNLPRTDFDGSSSSSDTIVALNSKCDFPTVEEISWTDKPFTDAGDPNESVDELQKETEQEDCTTLVLSMETSPKSREMSDVTATEDAERSSPAIVHPGEDCNGFENSNDCEKSQTEADVNITETTVEEDELGKPEPEIPDLTENPLNNYSGIDQMEEATEPETESNVVTLSGVDGVAECCLTPDGEGKQETNQTDLPSLDDELEDGEVIDEPEDSPEKTENVVDICPEKGKNPAKDFISRKIERRHSTSAQTSNKQRNSQPEEYQTWSRKKFSKAKSCPPEVKFTELESTKQETRPYIPVEDIPLPLGPPPFESCFDLIKYASGPPKRREGEAPPPRGQLDASDRRNATPPASDPPGLGIFERSTKIKFSLVKRSKFSKSGMKELKPEENGTKIRKEIEKTSPDFERHKIPTPAPVEPNPVPESETEKLTIADGVEEGRNERLGQPTGLSCEDLGDTAEVIDSMTDFIRDEFYECEDIPTSEDFTNGEDLEIERVNDDKFRNIMQNCLDNAKKFLNVGNLKLFSCSVDDLLELDCQGSDSSLGENDPEKPANHISRDVLLTSCEDANDDLGLSENVQPADISMDFVPSFCTDVCPEILPVDNWPYLEEEVPSSPTKAKPDESDLIPSLENAFSSNEKFSHKNGLDKRRRKRVASETSFKGFHRKSLAPEEEALLCMQRRKTIDAGESLTVASCGRDIRDLRNDIMRLKNEAENKSLKCRLSLDKITDKHGINFGVDGERVPENGGRMKSARKFDYRSPSWQPKVMLFRISKHELRKVLNSSKTHSRFPSTSPGDSTKRKISCDLGYKVDHDIKKHKSDTDLEKLYIKPVQKLGEVAEAPGKDSPKDGPNPNPNEEKLIDLSRLDSIKGSLTAADVKKRKKSRFRNLHTKRKTEGDATKDVKRSPPTLVDAETVFEEIFKDCVSNVRNRNSTSVNNGDEASKKTSCEMKPDTSESSKGEKQRSHSQNRSSDEWKRDKHREKYGRNHDHRDRRREKSEGKEQSEHKDRHRESESRRHGHVSSKHQRRSPGGSRHLKRESESKSFEKGTSGGGEKKSRNQPGAEASWVCEVCGFNDSKERVVHIKNHPFHCQSCHLAFKTEAHFISHLTNKHKDIRNQHHCLLCELSFDTEDQYQRHLETREHNHLESVEKNTINTLFTWLTGAPCPVFGVVEMRPEWLPNQAGTVHFYHQATPLSLALQYLKMHHDLTSLSTPSSAHPN